MGSEADALTHDEGRAGERVGVVAGGAPGAGAQGADGGEGGEGGEGAPERTLLAVDLGLRAGLALFGGDGRLLWARSHNFGSRERLRRGAHGILSAVEGLAAVYVEGDRSLGAVWLREAQKQGGCVMGRAVAPETWRERLLLPRERRSGEEAKAAADVLARRVFAWSGLPRPTALRHDAAEAVLIGLFGVLELGWLDALPALHGPPTRPR